MSIGGHQSAKMQSDTWLTPRWVLDALGEFDLDPCCPPVRPWETASKCYTKEDDGLVQPWFGRVWCNPPYGLEAAKFLSKLADHGNGIALIFARTETKMFFDHVWNKADGLLFIQGRLFFCDVNGVPAKANSGAPSVLIAYGNDNAEVLKSCNIPGRYIALKGGKVDHVPN